MNPWIHRYCYQLLAVNKTIFSCNNGIHSCGVYCTLERLWVATWEALYPNKVYYVLYCASSLILRLSVAQRERRVNGKAFQVHTGNKDGYILIPTIHTLIPIRYYKSEHAVKLDICNITIVLSYTRETTKSFVVFVICYLYCALVALQTANLWYFSIVLYGHS